MNKTRRVLLLTLALLPLAGVVRAEHFEAQAMTVDEMRANGGLIVDIRTPKEWAEEGVIAGARLVTFEEAETFLAELGTELASGRDLILICSSGRRSEAAAHALSSRITNKIISVAGGMIAVQNAGYHPIPAP